MVSDQTAQVPAGWYPDPYGASEMRWWDGQNWTDSIHPPPASTVESAPAPAPEHEQAQPAARTQPDAQTQPSEQTQPAEQTQQAAQAHEVVAPAADIPAVTAQEPLPSRREMRLRNEMLASEPATHDADISATPVEPSTDNPTPSTGPVPDSSTPTAFDWLSGVGAHEFSSPPLEQSPSLPQATEPPVFPLLDSPASMAPVSASTANDATGISQAGPAESWTHDPAPHTVDDDSGKPTATRMATVSSWFIAAMPLLAGILAISAVKGQENYPNYVPAGVEWWMLVAAVLVGLYVVTVILAVADQKKLDWAGYYQPPHWAWAFLTAPVYLLVRTITVKRETGRNSLLLWVWLLFVAALVGAWFAAEALAPELISGYTLPFL